MTEQDLIKFKNLSMQDGRLNLQWFADYVAQAELEEIIEEVDSIEPGENGVTSISDVLRIIRARGQE